MAARRSYGTPTALADEAAMLRRMALLADGDGRDDVAARFRSMADADEDEATAMTADMHRHQAASACETIAARTRALVDDLLDAENPWGATFDVLADSLEQRAAQLT